LKVSAYGYHLSLFHNPVKLIGPIALAPPHIRRVQHVDLLRLQNPYELTEQELRLIEEKTNKEGESEEDLIFQAGEQARLKFMYSGAPKPNVCVYHEADLVDGEETGAHGGQASSRRGVLTEVSAEQFSFISV